MALLFERRHLPDLAGFHKRGAGHLLSDGMHATNPADFSKTNDAAFSTVTGLSIPVFAGQTYIFKAVLEMTCNIAGGINVRINGTATATAVQWTGVLWRSVGGVPPVIRFVTRATALATTIGDTATDTSYYLVLDGVIVVLAGGNLDVQFAQGAANAAASTVFANSSWQTWQKNV